MADNYLEKKFEDLSRRAPKVVHRGGPSLDTLMLRNRSVRGFDPGRTVTMEELRQIIEVNTRIASSKNQQALRFRPVTVGPDADLVNANIKMGALFRVQRARLAAVPLEASAIADGSGVPENKSAGQSILHASATLEAAGSTADAKSAAAFANCPDVPFPGTEPQAFILVYGTHAEDPSLLIDLGISLQSMSLKAVELGLNCLMIRAFNREAIASLGRPELVPLAVLAVGKSAERIFLLPTDGKAAPAANPDGHPLEYFRSEGVHYVPKLRLEDILV